MAKILIVDDSAVSRQLLARILHNTEHQIVGEAENGEKAIFAYRKYNPDIILMDLDMPGIGGLEAAKKIKENYQAVNIIIVSAHEQSYVADELNQYGINFFVKKPINNEKIVNALNSCLSQRVINKVKTDNNTSEPQLDTAIKEKKPLTEEIDLLENLDLAPGNKISVSHVSSVQDIKCIILEKEFNRVTIKFIKDIPSSNFSLDDPITLAFETKSEYYICEANIVFVNLKEKSLTAHITKVSNLNDEQLLEFFPTSLPVNIKEEFQSKNQAAIIKNMGVYNFLVSGKLELFVGSKVIFDMFLDSKVFNFSAEITSKIETLYNFEYNAKVTFIDLNSKKFLASYIRRLKSEHVDAIFNLGME